jgi:hypothetical protein
LLFAFLLIVGLFLRFTPLSHGGLFLGRYRRFLNLFAGWRRGRFPARRRLHCFRFKFPALQLTLT